MSAQPAFGSVRYGRRDGRLVPSQPYVPGSSYQDRLEFDRNVGPAVKLALPQTYEGGHSVASECPPFFLLLWHRSGTGRGLIPNDASIFARIACELVESALDLLQRALQHIGLFAQRR